MFEDFIAERITQLRQIKRKSARDMSLSIGQNTNYINQIENHKMLPSMQVFFYICEYLGITPQEFFDSENIQPELLKDLFSDLKKLDEKTLTHISEIVKKLIN